jgi:alpha-beta hydrolase superfamily lysophospholipase
VTDHPGLKVHLVGHSAGSILLGGMVKLSRAARAVVIVTAGLVAGGCMARDEGFVTDTLSAGTDTVTAPPSHRENTA